MKIKIHKDYSVTAYAQVKRIEEIIEKVAMRLDQSPSFQKSFAEWARYAVKNKDKLTLKMYVLNPFSNPYIQKFLVDVVQEIEANNPGEIPKPYQILQMFQDKLSITEKEAEQLYRAWL